MLETTADLTAPRIQQLSIFLPNRVGALLRVTRKLEEENVHLLAVSIVEAADHAVVRVVVDRPAVARKALLAEGYGLVETELLGVELPMEKKLGLRQVLSALIRAEVNIHYVYSLLVSYRSHPVLALHVDDVKTAGLVLKDQGLNLVGQDQLELP